VAYAIHAAILAISAAAFLIIWYQLKKHAARQIISRAELHARQLTEDSARYAETIKREANLEAKDKFYTLKNDWERQIQGKKQELQTLERRLHQKEENLERKVLFLENKEHEISAKEQHLLSREKELQDAKKRADCIIVEQKRALERVAGVSTEEAKRLLMRNIESDARQETAAIIKKMEDEAREHGKELARDVIVQAIQRTAAENVIETCVSVVPLPSDDLKGRIIGREGRNIRALEMATGVDLIVDDTPEAILVSAFDGFRREVAKVAVQRLISDGRIHPARIEEIVEKTRLDLEAQVLRDGQEAAIELEIHDIHPEILKLLGKLRYRTSYGQNVLIHSKEVALLCALMAAEIGAKQDVAKRAGLLHDIGKAVDKEAGGTHLEWSIEYAKRFNECPEVVHAIACHHMDIPFETPEAFLVQAGDTISAARPGARREILENYVQRLEKLEKIADSFAGVQKAYALQAGREIRILVDSARVGDREAIWLSKDVARKIESELQYPGQIKVTVVREMRAVDYAK
jgi:ribonuclease Y